MKLGRVLIVLALLIGGFAGLAMTVCGGGFFFAMIFSRSWSPPNLFFALISLGSIAIGVTVVIAVLRTMKELGKE